MREKPIESLCVRQFNLKVGDIVVFDPPPPDTRNWWQRHAPLWLGGQREPPARFVVTNVATGARYYLENS